MLSSMPLMEDIEDFVDVKAKLGGWMASHGPCSPAELVDRYEREVEQFAVLEVEVAHALKAPTLIRAAQTHADATRQLAAVNVSLARTLLNC